MTSSVNDSLNRSMGSCGAFVTPGTHRVSGPSKTDAPSSDTEVFAIGRRRQFSASEKRALLAGAERVMLADTPALPLYLDVSKRLVKPYVRGWQDNVMNVQYGNDLRLGVDP